MQTDIQTFKHWTAASKPNSWFLGLATSQPDKPLPTGGSQIFLGDPQSHRTLVIWSGASLWFWGTRHLPPSRGLPGVKEAACLGQSNHCDFAPTPVDWPQGSIPSRRVLMFKDVQRYRGLEDPDQESAGCWQCWSPARNKEPATRFFFHIFPSKCSDSRGFSPGVHSHELDLPRCLWLKKWFYPHLSADSDGFYPPPMPNFSLGRICRIRRRSAPGLWGVPIQIANGFLVLSCVQGVEMGHLPLQSLEVRKKTTVA